MINRGAGRLGVLAVVVTSGVLLLGSLQAADAHGLAATTPVKAKIVLNVPDPQTLYEDSVTQLTGNLTSGKPDALVIFRSLVDGSWVRLATTRTDSSGAFSYDYTPPDPGALSLQAVHPLGHGALYSLTQTVDVLNRRLYLSTESSYDTFTDVVVTGWTLPASPDRRILIEHYSGGKWVPGAFGYTGADGHYSIDLRSDLPGDWTIRAYSSGPHPHHGTQEYSFDHTFTVDAVLHPVVSAVTAQQLGGSYHAGCPVGPSELRNVDMTFKTFAPTVDRGTLVVRDTIVNQVIAVFGEALEHGYPIRKIIPAAHYDGHDVSMMYHDDTSAFNCRDVTGDPGVQSPHSYGVAIDIDTVENPYQDLHGTWWPQSIGQQYRNRSHAYAGMLYDGSLVTQALKTRGFRWGGDWSHPDYQHFDTFSNGPNDPSARQSGPLSARSMPSAGLLGAGWTTYDDPGGPEAGWTGNGTFVHARDGREAANGVLPLGCATRPAATLPTPGFALQGAYRSGGGAPAQAVVMQFSSVRAAAAYFAGLQRMLAGCIAPDGPSGVAVRSAAVTDTSFVGQRTYSGHDTWSEVDVRAGDRVTVLLSHVSVANPTALVAALSS